MRLAFPLALLLSVATAAQAQTPTSVVTSPAPLVDEPPQATTSQQPAIIEVNSAEVRVERKPRRESSARQEETSRALWFVVGALVAVAVVLALTL